MRVEPFIWMDCPDCGEMARERLGAAPGTSVPCGIWSCYSGGSEAAGKIAAPTRREGRPVKLVNLTPHEIRLVRPAHLVLLKAHPEVVFRIPPARQVARVAVRREDAGHIDAGGVPIPLARTRYGEIEGLPSPQPGTLYIVSSLVAAAARDRTDLLIPDELVRDEQGKVVGARGLAFPA